MRTEAEIAWAAGFFEGEGSWIIQRRRPGAGRPNLRVQARSTDLDVLERFAAILGRGNIRQTTWHLKPGHEHFKPCYSWDACGHSTFVEIFDLFEPYLGERRKARALELLRECSAVVAS